MVESKAKQVKSSIVDFPKLMIAEGTGYIVLFFKEKTGTLVGCAKDYKNHMNIHMGLISYEWVMEDFKDFNGTITLENV